MESFDLIVFWLSRWRSLLLELDQCWMLEQNPQQTFRDQGFLDASYKQQYKKKKWKRSNDYLFNN